MQRHDPQLLKGVLPILLLRLLAQQESYGYELVQRLSDAGLTGIVEGTVYPALARLEREGWVSSRLVRSASGPARKYYRPTATGSSRLVDATEGWTSFVTVVDNVLRQPVPPTPDPGGSHD